MRNDASDAGTGRKRQQWQATICAGHKHRNAETMVEIKRRQSISVAARAGPFERSQPRSGERLSLRVANDDLRRDNSLEAKLRKRELLPLVNIHAPAVDRQTLGEGQDVVTPSSESPE